jgi:glycosyltransferase involved in cell wall biosynthesis
MLIDLIIPAYNAHKTLPRALVSIANQTIKDKVKVTIVDDASPDGGYDKVVAPFKDLLNINIITLDKNGGPGTARKVGVEKTNLPYIMFLDADDIYTDSLLFDGTVKYLEQNPLCAMVSVNFIEESENQIYTIHRNDLTWCFSKTYRRGFLQKNNINFSDLRSNEDLEMNTKVRLSLKKLEFGEEYIEFITDKVGYLWSYKEDSITRKEEARYSYNEGIIGGIEAKMRALEFAKENTQGCFLEILGQVPQLYNDFNNVANDRPNKPEWLELVFTKMLEYWEKFGKKVYDDLPKIDKALIFNKRDVSRNGHVLPMVTFEEFIDMLNRGFIDENFKRKYLVYEKDNT